MLKRRIGRPLPFLVVFAHLGLLGFVPELLSPVTAAGAEGSYEANARPFLARYCFSCHGEEKQKADLNLEAFGKNVSMYKQRDHWELVRDLIVEREMPPEEKLQPSEEERLQLVDFINNELAKFDCDDLQQPGRVTLRRLNRAEYNNTIRDLMGVDFEPAADFPLDEVGYGFDNIGDVLSLSPILMEKYLNAADQIVSKAILSEVPAWPPQQHFEAETFRTRSDDVRDEERVMGFFREGTATKLFRVDQDGTYLLKIRAYGQQAGSDPARLSVRINRQEAQTIDVPAFEDAPGIYTLPIQLIASSHRLELGYTNNYNQQNHPVSELNGDRNLFVDYVILEGPQDSPPPSLPESHTRIIPQQPELGQQIPTARRHLKRFVSRAYRRPATEQELNRLTELFAYALEQKAPFEQAMQVAVQAVLSSPSFLYRWELDPSADGPEDQAVRTLNPHEFASRLSYFLWSSMPDQTLFDLAADGSLLQTKVLEAQVKRMLQDPKADALVTNFAGQWLQFRNLDTITPDPDLFPTFDDDLRASMRKESELFFGAIMREDRSLLDFLDADFTYVDGRLAQHYGLEGEFSASFQRVSLDQRSARGGILTQASTLALTANPTRTSPVIRGKWVLEQILGTPPPPPPPNVEELSESQEAITSASLRERLEIHRANPECATCHEKMDPIGFAFENFDAIGAWRDLDGRFPIDPSGELPDGRRFKGPKDLIAILKTEDTFIRTVTEKMLTFALGRGLEYYDKCATDEIMAATIADNYRFSALVQAIVTSEPFQKVRLITDNL